MEWDLSYLLQGKAQLCKPVQLSLAVFRTCFELVEASSAHLVGFCVYIMVCVPGSCVTPTGATKKYFNADLFVSAVAAGEFFVVVWCALSSAMDERVATQIEVPILEVLDLNGL